MKKLKLVLLALMLVIAAPIGFVYLAPGSATQFAISASRQYSGLVRKEIDLPGGLHYVYLEGGTGETLMLLHGFGANKDNFTRPARYLTPHYRVIVPDHIGFGESSHPPQADYAPAAQVERLRSLAQALGAKTLHLGGSSMGGQIALNYAARYPSEVASLWLLDPAGVWSAPQGELAKIVLGHGRNPLIARNEEEFAQTFAFVMSDPPFVPRPMLNVMAQESIRNVALAERIFGQLISVSVEELVAGMKTPALIVWGEQDRAINVASAAVLHGLMPGSEVIVMPGVGHLPMVERPRQTAEDYVHFRRTLKERPLATRLPAE